MAKSASITLFHCALLTLPPSTVAVALWVLEDTPVKPTLKLVLDSLLDGGVGPITVNNPKWEPRHVV